VRGTLEGNRKGGRKSRLLLEPLIERFGADRWMARARHGRWHVRRGIFDKSCEFCNKGRKRE
jgi:hypothetical protein